MLRLTAESHAGGDGDDDDDYDYVVPLVKFSQYIIQAYGTLNRHAYLLSGQVRPLVD